MFDKIKIMEMKILGNTNITVTPFGMGVLTIGPSQLDRSLEEGARLIRYAMEQGVSFLDTAESYRTYPYIKRALKELERSFAGGALPRPVVSSKSLAQDYKGMNRSIQDCRAALGLDQIDIFLLHEVVQAPDFKNRSGAWACLQDAKAKGYVKAVGISTHHVDTALEAVNTPGIDILFPLINFRSMGIRKDKTEGTREEMETAICKAAERGIGVFAMKALGGGNLVREYIQALDYVTALPGIQSVMLGFGCKKDVDDAVAYFEGRLTEDYIPDVSKKRMFVDRGDCAGCGACISHCTSKAISFDDEGIAVIDAQKCIMCGYCVPVCPTRAMLFL